MRNTIWLASLLLGGVADAQPAELLPYTRWNLSYVYSVEARLTATGQTVNYEGSSTGEVGLEWDMDTVGERRFNGPSKAPTLLRYEGTLVDESTGCGMSELMVGDGLATCSSPTRLDLGDDGWEVNLGCLEAPVAHTFQWLGPCGPQFDYPIDPVTSWRWHIEDRTHLAMPIARFSYPASGSVLEGSWADSAPAFLAPLWTTIGSGAPLIARYHVAYVLTPLDPEDLVLELDDTGAYRDWRPSAQPPDQHGSPLDLEVRLYSTTGKTPSSPIERLTWELEETSREPGIAMNYPLDSTDTRLDLRLHPAGGSPVILEEDGQRLVRVQPEGYSDRVQVVPYDWGGWAWLKVTAVLTDGRSFVARVKSTGASRLVLPRRADSSLIADSWKAEKSATGADDSDGEDQSGDGLTLYEEYRGFYEDGHHISGDAKRRDLFVRNEAQGVAWEGIAYFGLLSDFAVRGWLRDDEIPRSRVINGNHAQAPHRVDQHGLIVVVSEALKDRAYAVGGPGTPRMISRVELLGDWEQARPIELGRTVAHELFHCANVYHHGESDEERTWHVDASAGRVVEGINGVRLFQEPGVDVTAAFIASTGTRDGKVVVGAEHGQHSGDEYCIMRYSNARAYDSRTNPQRDRFIVREVPGLRVCRSAMGTGVNGLDHVPQPRYGDAAAGRGNCFAQLLINDDVTPPRR